MATPAFIPLFLSSLGSEPRGPGVIFRKDGHNGSNPACTYWEGQGLCPSRNRGTQGLTGGHTVFFHSARSLAARCRSAASSTSSSWQS